MLGPALARLSDKIPPARPGDRSERFIPPVALPTGLPGRHYFLVQPPLDAGALDPDDRASCQAAYDEVKAAVEVRGSGRWWGGGVVGLRD